MAEQKATVVLIHGLWMTPLSWEHWVERYTAKGYKVETPAWPGFDRPDEVGVAECRDIAVALEALFRRVHRARDVDRKDKFKVYLDHLAGVRHAAEGKTRNEGEGAYRGCAPRNIGGIAARNLSAQTC